MGSFTMQVTKPSGGGQSEVPSAGNHAAVLVGIIDLGTRLKPNSFNAEQQKRHEVFLVWELTDEQKSASNINHTIAKALTLSFHEKANLRKLIEGWRGNPFKEGEAFDLTVLLGKKCLLNVIHKQSGDRTFAEVGGVSPVPKGMTVPANKVKPLAWDIGEGSPIPDADWIPWFYGHPITDEIEASDEYKARHGSGSNGATAPAGDAAEDEDRF